MTEKTFWNQELETMPADKLRELEAKALREQLAYVYSESLFYRQKFDEKGVHPDDLKSREGLQRFPFTTKEDLRQTQESVGGVNALPLKEDVKRKWLGGNARRLLNI